MTPPVTTKPLCSKELHPRTAEFGFRRAVEGWRCRPCKAIAERERYVERRQMKDETGMAESCPAPCGLALAEHARCAACSILCGPWHLEPFQTRGLCSSCLDRADNLTRASAR